MTNLVRKRFLDEMDKWLTPDLLYHCFTGESDAYRLAHVEQIQPAQRHILLNMAEQQWPKRLESIAEDRQHQRNESRRLVRTYTKCKRSKSVLSPLT